MRQARQEKLNSVMPEEGKQYIYFLCDKEVFGRFLTRPKHKKMACLSFKEVAGYGLRGGANVERGQTSSTEVEQYTHNTYTYTHPQTYTHTETRKPSKGEGGGVT